MDESERIRGWVSDVLEQVMTMTSADYACVLTYDREADRASPLVAMRQVRGRIEKADPPGVLPRTAFEAVDRLETCSGQPEPGRWGRPSLGEGYWRSDARDRPEATRTVNIGFSRAWGVSSPIVLNGEVIGILHVEFDDPCGPPREMEGLLLAQVESVAGLLAAALADRIRSGVARKNLI